jgi:hypothetical protein
MGSVLVVSCPGIKATGTLNVPQSCGMRLQILEVLLTAD